ncbi:MAG: penicillin-binding protein [Cytophagales bacterium]|nr:penicillin-binding protein [Cytophagales bacterium]
MNIKKEILLRVKVAFVVVIIISLGIVYSIFDLQFTEGKFWKSKSENINFKYKKIKASRGNILSDDGSILATSLPFYKVALDPSIPNKSLLENDLDSLALLLSSFFKDKSKSDYRNNILNARKNNRRYLLLNRKKIGYQEKKILTKWPIFREGRLNGGVIFEKMDERYRPFSRLGYRTIGSVDENNKGTVGIEYSFNTFLNGMDGEILTQKIAGNYWRPIYNGNEVQPKNGFDVITTVNVNLQDIAESALLKGLKYNDADYGSVILMEVETGEIKAISNFSKNKSGYYTENYNHALQGMHEPGSTFKLASILAYIEETNRSVYDSIDTGEGEFKFYSELMKDHKPGGYGKITIKEIFEKSSNIGVAKMIDETFNNSPQKFLDYLKTFGFDDNFNFQIFGSSKPQIKSIRDSTWSKVSLPWMAHGYELMLTPLHTLSFYNAVANNGKYVEPRIVKEIRNANRIIEKFDNSKTKKIADLKSINTVKKLLEGVVENGTADNIKHSNYKIAGKTGTAKKVVNGRYANRYYTSFAGFFPSEDPKYSCIVVIDNPKRYRIYGSDVAAPVFKEIADKIFISDEKYFQEIKKGDFKFTFPQIRAGYRQDLVYLSNNLSLSNHSVSDSEWVRTKLIDNSIYWESINSKNHLVPNVVGMTLKDAIYILESRGLKVSFAGRGRVRKQNISPGKLIKNYKSISISLG